MKKHKADLSEWRLDFDMIKYKFFLVGKISKDKAKRFKKGAMVQTSTLIKIDFETMIAETQNTIYNLKSMGFNL